MIWQLVSKNCCCLWLEVAFLRPKNLFFGIWWRRILHEENRRRNRRIEQLKWMGFSMKLWLKLKIFLTFKWRFSSFIQIEVSRSYKISYIIGAIGSDRKQKPVQYFHFFQSNDLRTTLMDSGEKIQKYYGCHLIFISRGLKTSILGPKLGSFLVQFFFDDYLFFMKKAIFFFVLHKELKTEENATSNF